MRDASRLLKVNLKAYPYEVGTIHLPKVRVRIGREDNWSPSFHAMVDTGSAYTLASPDVASALAIPDLKKGRSLTIVGVGGTVSQCYEFELDLRVGANPETAITLPKVKICFTEAAIPTGDDVLIGQHDALERLQFNQRNQPPDRVFVLRFPAASPP